MKKPASNDVNLSVIEIPDLVLGPIATFRNFDPERILDFQYQDDRLVIFISEIDRLASIQEFRSTIEAFLYEVERGVRPEVEAYRGFQFDPDFTELSFTVERTLFEQDSSAKMIELSIVEDALKYQIYSRKRVGVTVYYIDTIKGEVFLGRNYPQRK